MYKIRFFLVLVGLLTCFTAQAQWDPDAGLYRTLAQREGVSFSATSGEETLPYLADGDVGTQWRSEPLLPLRFLTRPDLNALADSSQYRLAGSSRPDRALITDGSLYGLSRVKAQGGQAWLHLSFDSARHISQFFGRFRATDADLSIFAVTISGDSSLITRLAPGHYQWERYVMPAEPIRRLALYSDSDFLINEIGALQAPLTEEVVVDLGRVQVVTTLRSRHWSAFTKSIQLYTSQDGVTWTWLTNLDPQAKITQEYELPQPQGIRYFKLVYHMMAQNHKQAYLWEFSPQDATAPYGAMPSPARSPHTLTDMLGINAFWGWGYNRYTDQLQPGEGPEMYQPVATYARDYHNMNWDIVDPDDDISFADMAATGGTPAYWWLNWEREYGAWIQKGMPVHASIQFVDFPDSAWNNPYSSAYKYGVSFARFFGPTFGNGQVRIVEVGNEPWAYDSTLYRTILRGMARGLKEGDPAMVVLPCALQAYHPGAEFTSAKNYIGARISATEAEYLDGINLHSYSFYKGVDGIRRGVYPEHANSQMRGILSGIRWRNHNMPGKPVYVTEWGWDSDGAGQECVHNECVSEAAAAAYVTRGLLMMQRMGVDKATYFYHSNLWGMTLFTRSGLTGSKEVNFAKKRSFLALESLNHRIGDRYFLGVLQENEEAWVYLLGDATGRATHLVAWRPMDAGHNRKAAATLRSNVTPRAAWRLDGRSSLGSPAPLPNHKNDLLYLTLDAYPLVVEIDPIMMQVDPPYRGEEEPATLLATETPSLSMTQRHQPLEEAGMAPLSAVPPSGAGLKPNPAALRADGSQEGEAGLPQKLTTSTLNFDPTRMTRQPNIAPMIWLGPVPAEDVLILRLDQDIDPAQVYQIGVWDFNGRRHYLQMKGFQKENHIWVNHLPVGAYRVVVFLRDGTQVERTVTVVR